MSTASVPQEGKIDAADFAAILSTTLAMAAEAGLAVGVRPRPATGDRSAGLLIFIEGLSATADGRLIADSLIPQVIEGHAKDGADTAIVDGQRV